MIKVNLLPIKRKKKPKPVPNFIVASIFITLGMIILMVYLVFYFNSKLSEAKEKIRNNDTKIFELKQKIKAVEDYERINKDFKERSDIIEELSKNRALPVKVLDEISSRLPKGIWLQSLSISGDSIEMNGYGYTNDEIVNYVDNLKISPLFTDVYLQESRSSEIEKTHVYAFRLTFKLKG
jgi:type IV pilus assembly protein PilN